MLKTPIKAVLFDLDGTLLDTANDLGASLNFVLNKYGLSTIDKEQFRPIASDGAKGLLELGFSEQLSDFDFSTLRQEFLNYYQENIATHTCLYDGIEDLLTALNTSDVPWGVVTNKPIGLTNILLPHFPIFKHSLVTIGGDSLPQRKPHPAPLFHACEVLKVSPESCLYVGDAPRDIEAGNAAKMPTAIAEWGYISDLEACKGWNADMSAKQPINIAKFIL